MTAPEDRLSAGRALEAARSNLIKLPLVTGLGLVSAVVVVRVLSPETFALYALAIALRTTLQLLTDLGTGSAAARLFGELERAANGTQARRLYRRLAWIRLGIAAVFGASLLAFPDAYSELFSLDDGERAFLLFLGLLAVAEVLGALGFYVLTGTFRQDAANQAQLLFSVLQPSLVIAAAAFGFGLSGILAAVLIASYVRSTVLVTRAARAVWSIPCAPVPERPLARVYTRVTTSTLVGKLATWVHSRQLVTILGMSTAGRTDVAVFAVAYDFVHQVLMALSGLFYNLLLPGFVSRAGDREAEGRLLSRSVRVLAIAILPTAAALMALYPSLSEVLFGNAYDSSIKYALVIIPALALELVLSGPCTSYMTADDTLIVRYRKIKAATLIVGAVYFFLLEETFLGVVLVMMSARAASTVALYVSIRRQTGLRLDVGWLLRLVVVWSVVAAAGLAASAAVPGHAIDIPVVAAVVVLTGLIATRVSGVLTADDLRLVDRVLPEAKPVTKRVGSWIGLGVPQSGESPSRG